MKLHEAIQKVLVQSKKELAAAEIARVINTNSWYSKKDDSEIKSSQVVACVKKYPELFNNINGLILLKGKTGMVVEKLKPEPKQKRVSVDNIKLDSSLMMKVLVNEKNFKAITQCEHTIPDKPGLFCIRIKKPKELNPVFTNVLARRKHTIMYIGIASKSLQKRFLNEELRANGYGAFFRSLGAVLGYTPPVGSLVGKSNQNKYKFSAENEQEIIEWIDENLIINWVTVKDNLKEMEESLIKQHLPLLNIASNPGVINNVSVLRNKCKEIARSDS